jgi:hypothetical protein
MQTKKKAILIRSSGQVEDIEVTTLEDLQKAVGGFIQDIPLGQTANMLMNEDGKGENLPTNGLATSLCQVTLAGLADDDYVVGDVLVLGRVDDEGEYTDCPHGLQQLVVSAARDLYLRR